MDEDQWRHLYQSGIDLHTKYEKEGHPEDLSGAIDHFQRALALRPHGDPGWSYTLNYLGVLLLKRYNREGDLDTLIQCIAYHQENLTLWPPGNPDRRIILTNLANALGARYHREGDLGELARIIEYRREALNLCSPGNPSHSICLGNLASALATRYKREGELADLVLVIQLNQQALDLRPPSHPLRDSSLNSLAMALLERYKREGELADLVQTIQLGEQALELRPPGHLLRPSSLNSLANAFQMRYDRERASDDLNQAITYYQEALTLRPPGHSDRSITLNCLAGALEKRYRLEGKVTDLVNAINHTQEALDLCPPGSPLRSASLTNLAQALEKRYLREGDLDDLIFVIKHRQEALDLRPPGHPGRSTSLRVLANTLLLRYNDLYRADQQDRIAASNLGASNTESIEPAKPASDDYWSPASLKAKIIALLQEASRSSNCSPKDCLLGAAHWIIASKRIDPDSTLDAYTSAMQQLDIVLAFGQSLDQRHDRFLSDDLWAVDDLGDEAAIWAIQRGELEYAIELLEQGRALLLTQIGRYRVELDDLRQVDSGLADRFADLSQQLDSSVVSHNQTKAEDSMAGDQYGRFRNVSTKWYQTVDQIRMLPGFDTFLKPMPYNRLRNAAAEGPIIIVLPNESGSDALVVSQNSPIHHVHLPLATSEQLAKLSQTFTRAINRTDHATEKLCITALKSLWRGTVGPIARVLQNDLKIQVGSRIWWCPTSVASSLPLHAAGLYSKRQPTENLPDLYVSSYTSTLQTLFRARRNATASPPNNVLVISQPNTPGEEPLNCATEEAGVIASIISPLMNVTMLSREAGIRADVQRAMRSHPWVHFICHGVQAYGRPFDSYLSLHDGHLTLRNIIERNLPSADFCFLAACHSAAGDEDSANEVLHLAAAMQFAGFRGVVGTLWAMADEDGPPLAEVFYREMAQRGDSRGAAKALSEAIKHLRCNKVPVNRWMRFVHIGI